jgi:hypothetical protein
MYVFQFDLPYNEMTSDIPKEYSIKIPSGEVENKYVFASNQHGGMLADPCVIDSGEAYF